MKKFYAEFFACDCVELAQRLLGKILCVKAENTIIKKVITETEAYGINDTACHGYKVVQNATPQCSRKVAQSMSICVMACTRY